MPEEKGKLKNAVIIVLLAATIVTACVCVNLYQKCREGDVVLEYVLANTFLGLSFDFNNDRLDMVQEDYASDCNSYKARYFCNQLPKKYADEAKSIKKIVRMKGSGFKKYDITGLQMNFTLYESCAGRKELTEADFHTLSIAFKEWSQCDWETLQEDLEEKNINFMKYDYGIGDCIEKSEAIFNDYFDEKY